MASTSDTPTAAQRQFVEYDEYVDLQMQKARAHIKATDVLATVTLLVAAFVAYLLLFAVCDQWLFEGGFGAGARLGLLILMLGAGVTVFVRRVAWPLIRSVHPLYAARMIERADPNLKGNLLNFVDLQHAQVEQAAPAVLRAMEKRAAVELSHIDVDEAIDRRPLLRTTYFLLLVVVLAALYIVFSPKDPFVAVRRALLPTADIAAATETTISAVTPGDVSVPARTVLTIEADIRGEDADRAQILFTTADHKYVEQPVELRRLDDALPRFRGVLNGENGRGLLQDLSYSIVAGDARTREYQVAVVRPPSALVEEIEYAYPHYMRLENRSVADPDIDGWEGTTVTLRASANMPVASAAVVFSDSEDSQAKAEEIAMQVAQGTRLTATWKLDIRNDGTFPRFYRIQVKTPQGESDPDPAIHTVRIRPDERPEVALLSPTGDLKKPANAIVPLVIQAADPDFGLRSITLKAEKNGAEIADVRLLEDRELGQAIRGHHDFDLRPLRLRPGEMIHFWIEARDNKQPTANRGVTPRLKIEILAQKSPEENERDLAAEKQAQQDQLARADEAARAESRERFESENRPDDRQPREQPDRSTPQQAPEAETARPNEPAGDEGALGEPDRRNAEGRKPAGDDPQRALEKLVKKMREEEQEPENRNAAEEGQAGDRAAESPSKKPGDGGKSPDKSPSGASKSDSGSQKRTPDARSAEQKSEGAKGASKADRADPANNAEKAVEKNGKSGASKPQPGADPSSGAAERTDDERQPGEKPATEGNETAADGEPGEKAQREGRDQDGTKRENSGDKNSDKAQGDPSSDSGDEASQSESGADRGKSSQSSTKGGKQKSGGASGGDQSPGSDESRGSSSSDAQGAEEPAEPSGGARQKKATGEERGDADGSDKADPDAARANDDVRRRPDGQPGATQPSDKPGSKKNSDNRRKPQDGTTSRTDNARDTKRPPPGKKPGEQPGQVDDPPSAPADAIRQGEPERRSNDPSDAGNRDLRGEGRKNRQQSEQPDSGEQGNSAATDQGQQGGTKEGAGDKGDQPGRDQQAGDKKTGEAGNKPGEGSSSKSSEKGSQSGGSKGQGAGAGSGSKPSKGEGEGNSEGQPGQEGKGTKAGSKPGAGGRAGNQPGKPGSGRNAPRAEGGGISSPAAGQAGEPGDDSAEGDRPSPNAERGAGAEGGAGDDQAQLDYAKQATSLVLKKLKKQLERGEVEEDLLKEMGWDQNDLERFVQFLEENLASRADDDSPGALAKRLQFEELLRSLRIGPETSRREGGGKVERRTQQIGARSIPLPPEYREQFETYTKRLNKASDGARDSPRKPAK
ncbi:MAG: hypothetical protein ACT4QC_14615 [Planctomycetaceae bacterium]